MSQDKPKVWLGYLIVGMYFAWFALSLVPLGPQISDALARLVPERVAMLAWAACPILVACLMGPIELPAYLWVPLYGVSLVSLVFYAVSFHFHPYFAIAILAICNLEVYWLLPKWKANARIDKISTTEDKE